MSLLNKIRKNSIVNPSILKNSKYFEDEIIPTNIPIMNAALSGKLDGGFPKRGIVQIAAPPKHFKTNFLIEMMKAYQEHHVKKGEEYIIVLYDSELGSTPAYYENAGVDTGMIDHRPIKSVEELKSDMANLLADLDEGDNVLIAVDSIGMLRSTKETEDAIDNKQVADMTRAKQIKSLFRIITAESVMKQIPIIVVNHSYETQETYSKEVAAGGRGAQYAAHTLFFISKAQEKEAEGGKKVLAGFQFTLKAGLSRYVKEQASFPVVARFESGIDRYSGIFDLALESGHIEMVSKGWYAKKGEDKKTKTRRSTIESDTEYLEQLLEDKEFQKFVNDKYAL